MRQRYKSLKKTALRYLIKDQKGATAIEYGLIAGLIAAVLVGALSATGTTLKGIFETIEQAIKTASGG